ncbi:MAG: phosphatase PAP2 family protein [Firmicutes bacterium]|nr:phosphatase PAP2 family protein [Bacillota bacterium]
MKEQSYRAMVDAIRSVPLMKQYIIWFNRIVTGAVYLLYPALLALLAVTKNDGLVPAIVIPAISFILLSIVRDRINRPRPYEVFDLEPIIDKKTRGHSFPSRHIFCMFLIAMTVFYFYPLAGVLIGLVGAALAVNRVMGGVHFIRDVAAGALCGVVCGIIGFYVILPLLA